MVRLLLLLVLLGAAATQARLEPGAVGSRTGGAQTQTRPHREQEKRHSLKADDRHEPPPPPLPPWVPPPGGFPTNACPCGELCKPLRRSAVANRTAQFFGFAATRIYNGSADAWRQWDWQSISTVEVWSTWHLPAANWGLLCRAHAEGVRVVVPLRGGSHGDGGRGVLLNATARKEWITSQVVELTHFGLDGANFDVEGQYNASLKAPLTRLICETQKMMKRYLPDATLTFDLNITPLNPTITGGYDYPALAKCLNHIVPMAYDMTNREVGANAPLPAILDGVTRQYHALGIAPSRLVVALPWYAYVFRCSTATVGTNCSLPAGARHNTTVWETSNLQLGYGEVLDLHESLGSPPVTYDRTSFFKWFDFVNASTKQRHRVSYDDPDTLLAKYKALLRAGVAGVGAWTIAATQRQSQAATEAASRQMWAAVAHALHDAVL